MTRFGVPVWGGSRAVFPWCMRGLRRYDVDMPRILGLILLTCCLSAETALDRALTACRELTAPEDRAVYIAECAVLAQLAGDRERADALIAEAEAIDLPQADDEWDPNWAVRLTIWQCRLLREDTALADLAELPLDDQAMALTYPMLMTARLGRMERTTTLRPHLLTLITTIRADEELWLNDWEVLLIAARANDEALLDVVLNAGDGIAWRAEYLAGWVEEAALMGRRDQARMEEAAAATMLLSFGGGAVSERLWPVCNLGSAYAAWGDLAQAERNLAQLQELAQELEEEDADLAVGPQGALRLALATACIAANDDAAALRWAGAALTGIDAGVEDWLFREAGRRLITAGAEPAWIEALLVRPHDSARANLLLGVAEGSLARAEP